MTDTDKLRTNYCVQCKEYADELDRLRAALAASEAKAEKLAEAARHIMTYLKWTISEESCGCHPTMPSAVGAFDHALNEWSAK